MPNLTHVAALLAGAATLLCGLVAWAAARQGREPTAWGEPVPVRQAARPPG